VDPARFDQIVEDLESGRLRSEVPPHGTLSRVLRDVGLEARGQSLHQAGGPPMDEELAGAPPAAGKSAGTAQAARTRRRPPAAAGPELATVHTTTAVVSLDGGRNVDPSGNRTNGGAA
jgi:hypothetical protein